MLHERRSGFNISALYAILGHRTHPTIAMIYISLIVKNYQHSHGQELSDIYFCVLRVVKKMRFVLEPT